MTDEKREKGGDFASFFLCSLLCVYLYLSNTFSFLLSTILCRSCWRSAEFSGTVTEFQEELTQLAVDTMTPGSRCPSFWREGEIDQTDPAVIVTIS